MTRKETFAQIRALNMAATFDPDAGEYRVTFRADDMPDAERREAVASYTPDAADALGTARAMRAHFDAAQAA